MIDEEGVMLGVMSSRQALSIAESKNLDLVEISPNTSPPICKVMNFGKYKYEQQKKQHATRQKQKIADTKELKLRPTIADADYAVKLKSIKKFITGGDKVRIFVVFKGREITHSEVGFALINRIINDINEIAKPEAPPKLEGKQIFMTLSAVKGEKIV